MRIYEFNVSFKQNVKGYLGTECNRKFTIRSLSCMIKYIRRSQLTSYEASGKSHQSHLNPWVLFIFYLEVHSVEEIPADKSQSAYEGSVPTFGGGPQFGTGSVCPQNAEDGQAFARQLVIVTYQSFNFKLEIIFEKATIINICIILQWIFVGFF